VSNILHSNNLINQADGSIKLVNAHINSTHIRAIQAINPGPSGDIIASVNVQDKLIHIPLITNVDLPISKQSLSAKKKQLLKAYDSFHNGVRNEISKITQKQKLLQFYIAKDELKDLQKTADSPDKISLQTDIDKLSESIGNKKRPDYNNMIENTTKLVQYTLQDDKLTEYENEIINARDDQELSIKPVYETLLSIEIDIFKQITVKKHTVQTRENLQTPSSSSSTNRLNIIGTSGNGQNSTRNRLEAILESPKKMTGDDIVNRLISEM
jgi:hypothetical protein